MLCNPPLSKDFKHLLSELFMPYVILKSTFRKTLFEHFGGAFHASYT